MSGAGSHDVHLGSLSARLNLWSGFRDLAVGCSGGEFL